MNLEVKTADISISPLSKDKIPSIVEAFNAIGWNKPASLFDQYLHEQEAGERVIWLAFTRSFFAGYITLKFQSEYLYFKEHNIPEIVDFNVLPSYRMQGMGSALMHVAEREAKKRGELVGIGVGLYGGADGGYGAAQRLYVKRGYIPDGKGVTYNGHPVLWGKLYPIDDDLILWFTKSLK